MPCNHFQDFAHQLCYRVEIYGYLVYMSILCHNNDMVRTIVYCMLLFILISACGGQAEEIPRPTDTPIPPTRTAAPTSTPRQQDPSLTPLPTSTFIATPELTPSALPEALPDLSGVRLHEVTHLMDPRMFQVSMNGWPADMPEDVIVRVGLEFYTCDILFPDIYPDRIFCWGKAPPKGTEVKIQVILEDVPLPLLEIPFRVPYPSPPES